MSETSQTFRTTLWSNGGNNVGIVVPEAVVAAFDRGRRVPEVVTVDGGHRWLDLDDAPRTVDVPPDLAAAFAAHPDAAAAWAGLSYSKQNAHALSINGATTDETRARRVHKVIDALA